MMVDRTIAPAFVPPDKFQLPPVEVLHFDNGSRLFLLKVGDQPIVTIDVIFRSGTWFESQAGQAFFTAKMLTEGTRSFSAPEIAARLDYYGAFLEITPGFDFVNLALHLPVRHFEKVLEVLTEVLFEPAFREDELALQKQIQQNQLKVNLQKNSFVASREFRALLYHDHPYGHIITPESIEQTSAQVLSQYYQNFMHGKFDIFITGNFDELLTNHLSALMESRMKNLHQFQYSPFPESAHFDRYSAKEDSFQSAIYMGKRFLNRKHPDYPTVLLLNEVFGGYFGSRLMQNIREDKGYTYGIHSHMVHLRNDSYFVIGADVKKESRENALREIGLEIDRLKIEAIPKPELNEARNHLKGSVLNSLTSPMAVSEKLKNIYFYDLPADYYDRLFDALDAATSDMLLAAANTYLFDKPLSVVSVG